MVVWIPLGTIGNDRISIEPFPGNIDPPAVTATSSASYRALNRTIRVQAGIRWCDIQRFIDPHDLAIRIMQTYANFTVGGSLSVNSHGRYMGQGPLILSVRAISLKANGIRCRTRT